MKPLKNIWRRFTKPHFVKGVESLRWPDPEVSTWQNSITALKDKSGQWYVRFNYYILASKVDAQIGSGAAHAGQFDDGEYSIEDINGDVQLYKRQNDDEYFQITDKKSIEVLEKLTPSDHLDVKFQGFDEMGEKIYHVEITDVPKARYEIKTKAPNQVCKPKP